jgi:hypothetical protein
VRGAGGAARTTVRLAQPERKILANNVAEKIHAFLFMSSGFGLDG